MTQFRNLVFEGGGVKGIAYAGALAELEKQGMMKEIRRVAGTSAGAITAALVALGADSQAIAAIIGGTKFRKFMDDSFGVVRDTDRLLTDFGWYKGDEFSRWMQKQVHALTGVPELTFGSLSARVAGSGGRLKELHVVGTDLSNQIPVEYSVETTPEVPIWEAVRISMSIPLFFACMRGKNSNNVLVDGGVTWNYPIDLFDYQQYLIDEKAGVIPRYTRYSDDHVFNKETLGFRVDTTDEIRYEKERWHSPPVKIDDFFDYIKALVGHMNDMANKAHLHQNDWDRTVFIDAAGVGTTDFDLSNEQIALLIANGRRGVEQYLAWFQNPDSDPAPLNRL